MHRSAPRANLWATARQNWPWLYAIALFAGVLWVMGLMWTGSRQPVAVTNHTVAMPAAMSRGGGGEGRFIRSGSPALYLVYVTPLEAALAGFIGLNLAAVAGLAFWYYLRLPVHEWPGDRKRGRRSD